MLVRLPRSFHAPLSIPVLLGAALFSQPAHADIIEVDCLAGPITDIPTGVSRAVGGNDIIVVRDCDYTDAVSLGILRQNITIVGLPKGTFGVGIAAFGAAPSAANLDVSGDCITLLDGASDVRIMTMGFEDCDVGIEDAGEYTTVLANSMVGDFNDDGYSGDTAVRPAILGNYLEKTAGGALFGIHAEPTTHESAIGTRVVGNVGTGWHAAIQFSDGPGSEEDHERLIIDNATDDNSRGIHVRSGNNTGVYRNTVDNNVLTGIGVLADAEDGNIVGNLWDIEDIAGLGRDSAENNGGCGDGWNESNESCDDGNNNDTDSCSNFCKSNADFTMSRVGSAFVGDFTAECSEHTITVSGIASTVGVCPNGDEVFLRCTAPGNEVRLIQQVGGLQQILHCDGDACSTTFDTQTSGSMTVECDTIN